MKFLVLLLGLCLGFSVQASDRKVGNVIVVERTVSDVYDNCLKEIRGDVSKPSAFFTCVITLTQQPYEVLLTKGYLNYTTEKCNVESELAVGKMLITFGTKTPGSFEDGKACLTEALAHQPAPKVLIQTLEIR
jgi:hypothetical protein